MTADKDLAGDIDDLYRRILLRDADSEAIEEYQSLLSSGTLSLTELECILRNSDEFQNRSACLAMWKNFFDTILPSRYPTSIHLSLPRTTDRYAVLVEPRHDRHIAAVVTNMMVMLGEAWGLQVFHGNKNHHYVCQQLSHLENVCFTDLGVDNLDQSAYTELVSSERFWQAVRGTHVLYFQTDALLGRSDIDRFLEYDYIGAPWAEENRVSETRVGNGGLSLRRQRAMLDIACRHKNPGIPADVFFSKFCRIDGHNIASPEVAQTFAVENVFYPNPLGLHKAYFELSPAQLQDLLEDIRPPNRS